MRADAPQEASVAQTGPLRLRLLVGILEGTAGLQIRPALPRSGTITPGVAYIPTRTVGTYAPTANIRIE